MEDKKKSSKQRLRALLALSLFLFILLIGRLAYWQIAKGEELKRGALSQWTRGITLKPRRGIIYDRNGKKLAVSQNSSTVWVSLAEVNQELKDITIEMLSATLSLDEEEVRSIFKEKTGHKKIKQWITEEEAENLEENIKMINEKYAKEKQKVTGIQVVDDYRRYYPYDNFASHVIGFTDIDGNGLYGVESTYDSYLAGTSGKWVKTTDTAGRQLPFDSDQIYEAKDGLSIVLSLDETIQQIAEEATNKAMHEHKAKNISVIAMEPDTGEILAMVNKPDYNPNEPKTSTNPVIQEKWEKMVEEGEHEKLQEEWYDSWRNFALNDVYEPGSTFKLITAAAALEENIVNYNTSFHCVGNIAGFKGESISCPRSHGTIDFKKGMDVSCNTVFVNTAKMLGKEKFLKYIKAFGFGEKTDIDLNGEQYGLVPANVESIKDINLATISYGYGIALTPIQLVNATAAISNGGNLMRPHIVKAIVDSDGKIVKEFKPEVRRKVISESTSEKMLELMESVVSEGSGRNAEIPGYLIGGKTGTAKKAIDGRYIDGKYIGSFVATAPTDGPKITLLVVVDDPEGIYYGGSTSAPIAKEIIENILSYLEILPEEQGEKKVYAEDMVEVPNLINKNIGEAGKILNEIELRHMSDYGDIDSNTVVVGQSPESGKLVEKGSVIELELKKEIIEDVIPNLLGKDKKEIEEILKNMGIEYSIEGEGICKEQNPEPGIKIEKDLKLEIKLE